MKIGIIGQGFVGTAVREGLKQFHEIDIFISMVVSGVWHSL